MSMKNTTIILSTAATAILLIGCGSSDGTTTDTTSTGYLIDAAVENVHYKTTSGREGETDSQGRFEHKAGESVSFSLGKLQLGSTVPPANGLVTPKNLSDNNKTVILMLQTLQSLDSDGNTTNGITISQNTINRLNNLDENLSFSELNESTLINLTGITIDVNTTEAEAHLRESVYKWNKEHNQDKSNDTNFNLANYPVTPSLTQPLKDSLAYMGNEERLAHDIYLNLYDYHQQTNNISIKQLYNIATNAESQHIAIVQSLVKRYNLNASDLTDVNATVVNENNMSATSMPRGVYDIQKIQDLYNSLYALGKNSQQDALKVGCMVEVTDITDLDEYITQAQESNAADVEAAFNVLRDGSYRHYWAFDRALKNIGITNGCYYEGDTLLTNKEGIYPQEENGERYDENVSNNSQRNGNGQGYGYGRQQGRQ